jgi:hypothetical protein
MESCGRYPLCWSVSFCFLLASTSRMCVYLGPHVNIWIVRICVLLPSITPFVRIERRLDIGTLSDELGSCHRRGQWRCDVNSKK